MCKFCMCSLRMYYTCRKLSFIYKISAVCFECVSEFLYISDSRNLYTLNEEFAFLQILTAQSCNSVHCFTNLPQKKMEMVFAQNGKSFLGLKRKFVVLFAFSRKLLSKMSKTFAKTLAKYSRKRTNVDFSFSYYKIGKNY
jgi:hypothetical protein